MNGDERQDMQNCLKFDIKFIDLGPSFHVLINLEITLGGEMYQNLPKYE